MEKQVVFLQSHLKNIKKKAITKAKVEKFYVVDHIWREKGYMHILCAKRGPENRYILLDYRLQTPDQDQ